MMLKTDSIILLYYKIPEMARRLRRKSEELGKICTRDDMQQCFDGWLSRLDSWIKADELKKGAEKQDILEHLCQIINGTDGFRYLIKQIERRSL
jgi:hypothetical protein